MNVDLNSTNVILEETEFQMPIEFTIVYMSVIALIGVPGNVATIMIIIGFKNETPAKAATNYLIANLAVAEAFASAFYLFIILIRVRYPNYILESYGVCLFVIVFAYIPLITASLSLGLIAINRCMCVVTPLRYRAYFTRRRLWSMIAFAWLFGPVIMLSAIARVFGSIGSFDDKGQLESCTMNKDTLSEQIYVQLTYIASFVLPFVVMVVSCICILARVRKLNKRVTIASRATPSMKTDATGIEARSNSEEASTNAAAKVQHHATQRKVKQWHNDIVKNFYGVSPQQRDSLSTNQAQSDAFPSVEMRRATAPKPNANIEHSHAATVQENRITRTFFVIIGFYIFSYLYLYASLFLTDYPVLRTFGTQFILLNLCINPLSYAALNRNYREAYGKLFKKILDRALCKKEN